MATEVKKVKFIYFVYVHPKAFHLTTYKQNLFFDLCQLYWKITWDYKLLKQLFILEYRERNLVLVDKDVHQRESITQ